MNIISIVREVFKLLDPKYKRKYLKITCLQISTGLLDLIGLSATASIIYILKNSSGNVSDVVISICETLSFNRFSPSKNSDLLILASAIALIGFSIKTLVGIFSLRSLLKTLGANFIQVNEKFSDKFFRSGFEFITKQRSEETSMLFVTGLRTLLIEIPLQMSILATELSLLVIMLITLSIYDPRITLIVILYFLVVVLVMQRKLLQRNFETGRALAQSEIKGLKSFQELISGYKELTAIGKMKQQIRIFVDGRREALKSIVDSELNVILPKYSLEAALMFGITIICYTTFNVNPTSESVTKLAIFVIAGTRLLPSLVRLQNSYSTINRSFGRASLAARLIQAISITPDFKNLGNSLQESIEIPSVFGVKGNQSGSKFVVKNLSFGYINDSTSQIVNINLDFSGYRTIALVGPTGSGKSTLMNLLLGLLSPSQGRIRIEFSNSRDQSSCEIAYVPQNVFTFDANIRTNISLLDPTEILTEERKKCIDEKVWKVLEMVGLKDKFEQMSEGLDAQVGERGNHLSGGQAQRLGIARALFVNPRILFLDEATSALDAVTEAAVMESILQYNAEMKIIVIAHRLSTVREFDRIVYMSRGEVIAFGDFLDVCSKVPEFRENARVLGLI